MKWGKKPKTDPAAMPTDPKARRQLPSIRLPSSLETLVYILGGLIIVGCLGIIGACYAAPALVPILVYGIIAMAVLAMVIAIAAAAGAAA